MSDIAVLAMLYALFILFPFFISFTSTLGDFGILEFAFLILS